MQIESINTFYYRYLRYFMAKDDATATPYDKYMALSYAVRNQMVDKWIETQKRYHDNNDRRIYFLSMEYVIGRSLYQNIVNLGLEESLSEAAVDLGFSLDQIFDVEHECELGNGAKGVLAACFQEAMASLGFPAMGYGLHYDYSQFRQEIINGNQIEHPYDWLHKGHPWETLRPEYACIICLNGKISQQAGENGTMPRTRWEGYDQVVAVPYDYPVPGYRNNTVNTIRLWSARPTEEFLSDYVNHGDYVRACEETTQAGRITRVLFPDEDVRRATEMRIKQQYFLVSASLQDIIRRFKQHNKDILDLDKKVAVHMFGSRCALAVAELMRLLVDREAVPWNTAWEMTRNVFSYTSNAVIRDNLENWPTYLLEQVLPRHAQIIYEINQIHLDDIRKSKAPDTERIRELSLVEEGEVKRFKMAHLAALGSHGSNGVSLLQTEALRRKIFPVLLQCGSMELRNITNGVAHRRWLLCANRPLAHVITEAIGKNWASNPHELERLAECMRDDEFMFRLGETKDAAKRRLSDEMRRRYGMDIPPQAMFDVQIQRIHPYKRQVLHVLHILSRYLRMKKGEELPTFRVHLFAGKAMPSDHLAKQIIRLIWMVSKIINEDPGAAGKMAVGFVPNFSMSTAELLIPAADLSEQIATPHLEACATSNMKFAFNGAITIASRCGSNMEMLERIGGENIVVFGRGIEELEALRDYRPWETVDANPHLKDIFSFIEQSLSTFPDGHAVLPLLATLRDTDPYYILLDFADYIEKQNTVDALYIDRRRWLSMSLMNIAHSGYFSGDRMVKQYADELWHITP